MTFWVALRQPADGHLGWFLCSGIGGDASCWLKQLSMPMREGGSEVVKDQNAQLFTDQRANAYSLISIINEMQLHYCCTFILIFVHLPILHKLLSF